MNRKNVQHAIAIMKRAGEVGMCNWQRLPRGAVAAPCEEMMHEYRTAACFAGWVAVSPEFKSDGGSVDPNSGAPVLGRRWGEGAVAEWLGIPDAAGLCATDEDGDCLSPFYDHKFILEIKAEHVIEKLEGLLRA